MQGFISLLAVAILFVVLAAYSRKIQQGGFTPEEMTGLIKRGLIGGALLVIVLIFASSIVSVDVGDRLVVYNKFTKSFRSAITPGYAIVLPIFYERITYDVRTQVYTMSGIISEGNINRADAIEVLSSDGLKMNLDITVQYRLEEATINELHANIGPEYVEKIIRPTAREAIRNEFARHEATEAYSTKRDEIEEKLYLGMQANLSKYYMVLEEIQIRNIELPPTVVKAIEEKKAAQQEAERMVYILDRERQEKERIQIEAEAQAERIRIVNEALSTNPNYLNWLAIDKLNDKIQLIISDGNTILNLDALAVGQN